jgi:putative FmdB family regulatory protein
MPLHDYLCETVEIAKGTKSTSTARASGAKRVTHISIMLLSAFPSGGLLHTGKSEVPMDCRALTRPAGQEQDMPLYPYTCDSCGDFQDWQSMTACDRPTACPRCGTMSRRAVTAPTILGMDARVRNAHMRNEKSAHEPRVVRADDWKPHGHHAHVRDATNGHGSHLHQSSRPWMIGH